METGIMTNAQDALPPNILTAVRLIIERDCSVMDAYRIVSDYPNIQHVTVNMKSYTAQEIRQMPAHLALGAGTTEYLVNRAPGRLADIHVDDVYTASDLEWAENTLAHRVNEAIGNTLQTAAQVGTVEEVREHDPIQQGIYNQLINAEVAGVPLNLNEMIEDFLATQRNRIREQVQAETIARQDAM